MISFFEERVLLTKLVLNLRNPLRQIWCNSVTHLTRHNSPPTTFWVSDYRDSEADRTTTAIPQFYKNKPGQIDARNPLFRHASRPPETANFTKGCSVSKPGFWNCRS